MSKRLTQEDKRRMILEIFHKSNDFYQLKEIEKMGYKLKGIPINTIKDILQSLIDDDLVRCEKLGTSNYYWSFPSHSKILAKHAAEKMVTENESMQHELARLNELIESEAKERPEEGREILIERWNGYKKKIDEIKSQISEYKTCDPDLYDQIKKDISSLTANINKITDDIFILQTFAINKFSVAKSDFNLNFGISDEMDYI
ncbi:Meiotic nuclear division protein 1 like protein [Astathelohania contejeani]|uniref:Meiotic nuclear division protein 1 n=1 Tax=Astathelohania contejeani TaxID=164912 RepID=A0ABQ7HX29_9MICR|nr:Meiotic nuclear division protein 1 like protein [Thelohania contejeani]